MDDDKEGFKVGDGLYDSFVSGDQEIDGYVSWMSGEREWIDGAWDSADQNPRPWTVLPNTTRAYEKDSLESPRLPRLSFLLCLHKT